MKNIVTACTRDCPGACSIIAQEEDGKVIKLRGNPDHKITAGFLCNNTSKYLENFFYSPKRVLHPLLKRDGEWEQISWDEALDITASKIKEVLEKHGSQAILYYQGFGSRTALQSMNKRFFNLLGGVTTTSGTVCGGIGHVALEQDYGVKMPHNPLDQLNSNLIIVWGRNPAVTDVHLWRILRKARRNGTKLVVIDPVKTRTAKQADLFVQPAPGSDHYLAMALTKIILKSGLEDRHFIENHTKNFTSHKELLDRYSLEFLAKKCDVSRERLEELALTYARSKPSSIVAGWGVHRYRYGHLAFHMMNSLAAIAGNVGVSGGGVTQGFEEYEFFDLSMELDGPRNGRKLPMAKIGRSISQARDPPIEMIFVASGNPVNLNPNSSLVKKSFERVNFVVMTDHFLNDTADVADLFLPATTFLEEENLIGSFGHSWISPINPMVPPQGEAKSEFEIFQLLSQKLGFEDRMAGTPREWLEKMASPILDTGVTFEELQKGSVEMIPADEIPYRDGCFKTESGRFEFITDFKDDDKVEYKDFSPEKFPLHLLSTSPEGWVGSVVPESEMENGHLEAQAHPLTLKENGIVDGEVVLLESPFGKMEVKVRESEDVRSDFILAYKGGLMKDNRNINVLTGDFVSEKGEGAPYYETRVRLRNLS